MSALQIWGRANSINVQKVLWCCDELGLEYERIDAGGPFGRTRDPEYLAMNPNGLVPTISDDGFTLWESNAIVRYLAAKHGVGTLCPEDLRERADADRWMDWQLGTIWAAMRPVFLGLVRTPPEERDEAAIEEGRQRTIEAWDILETHMEGRDHALGDRFTMADIPLGVSIYRWFQLPIERPAIPNLEAYHERLAERPAFRERVMLPLT
ncbi:MAG: glutathione S-transferase family protein [Rubrobacteraceae bacterium]